MWANVLYITYFSISKDGVMFMINFKVIVKSITFDEIWYDKLLLSVGNPSFVGLG